MKMRNQARRCAALLLAACLLLSLAACGGNDATAATMHLRRTQGTVAVSDGDGKDVPLLENLGLYSGYGVNTLTESYAWIDLDDVKLAKMDQNSETVIQKEGKVLEIEVKSGSLFFNITEPLDDDETMNISTSTMLIGIRGTCGWVEDHDGSSRVYLLEGKVKCSSGDQTVRVYAGEMGVLTADGELTVEPFTARDVPAFVVDEVEADDDLAQAILEDSGIDVLNPDDPVADALEQYREVVKKADSYEYGAIDPATGTYRYALVRMRAGYEVPALLLEQDTRFGLSYAVVFQYEPDSAQVIQASGNMMEGVAQIGGFRGSLFAAEDGNGVLSSEFYSGFGMEDTSRITLNGNALQIDSAAGETGFVDIDWHDITDLSGLDSWSPNAPVSQPESAQPSTPETLPTDGNRIVFTGTVNTYTYSQVLALQGESDPNPGYDHSSESFQLIVLDTPQDMGLSSSSDPGFLYERTVSLVAVSGLGQYNGQHLIFSIDPYQTYWPSDTSLPLGQPSTGDVHVLGPAPSN